MNKYKITFIGRPNGAIGITYQITKIVEADNEVEASLKLYETHEHIRLQKIEILGR